MSNKQCKFCRAELPEGAKVCPVCGTPVPPEDIENQGSTEQNQADGQQAGGQNQYQYGQSQGGGQNQDGENQYSHGQYQYGVNEPGMNRQTDGSCQYGSGQPDYGQSNYNQYHQSNYNQTNYNQPNYGQQNYNQDQRPINGTPYMVLSILATFFCCLPLGIAGIIFASRINSLQRTGDYEGARAAAKKAKIFTILSAVLGLVALICYGIYFGFAAKDMMDDQNGAGGIVVENSGDKEPEKQKKDADAPDKKTAQPTGNLGDSWTSYTVEINGTTVTFPCGTDALSGMGLKLDTDDKSEDYMVNAGEYEMVFLENEKGNYIMADMVNQTESVQKIKDCQIGGIYVDSWSAEEGNLKVVFPGGVQVGTSEKDLVAAYGEPSDKYEGESLLTYTWYDGNSYFKSFSANIDAKSRQVSSLSIRAYEL